MNPTFAWIAVAACLLSPVYAEDRLELIDLIALDDSWTVRSAPVDYARNDIDQLVGDNAGQIREYGVVGASTFELSPAGSNSPFEVTLFEMIDSSAAFGLFALERDRHASDFAPAVVGTESYRQRGRLFIWQANFVIVTDGPEAEATRIGTLLAENILGGSLKAPVSTLLPGQGLVADSETYLLSPEAFRERTGMDPARLGFENSAEAAVAEYTSPGGGTTLLALLLYPTQHLASRHLQAWLETTDNPPPNRRSGPLLGIAADSSDANLTAAVLDALRYQSEVTWNAPPPDPLTLPHLILTIFTGIGIALGFTLVVGLSFGGVRIYLKTRYPDRFFGTSPGAELIQLHINQSVTRKQLGE
jgi:hypothetical protein